MNTAFRLWKVQMVPVNVQSLQAIASAVRLVQQKTVSASGTREKNEYVVSFLGYAPAEDPQIAVYVVLNRPTPGSRIWKREKHVSSPKTF